MRTSRAALAASCAAVAAVGGLAATSIAASGGIATVAGTGSAGIAVNGQATSVPLNGPTDVAATADGGFLIVDTDNQRLRRVTAEGQISTVAGGTTSDGDGDEATPIFSMPVGVAGLRSGDVLVTDASQHRISRVSASGTVTGVAGTGTAGAAGDGGSPTLAQLNTPGGIAELPTGGFVVADTNNNRIRKVEGGTITTVAGSGDQGFNGDGRAAVKTALSLPKDVAVLPDGDLLIADTGNGRIRRVEADDNTISTVAGGGTASGDGVRATKAALEQPTSVVAAADGGFAVGVAGSHRVRRVLPDGTITTLAGTGAAGNGEDGLAPTATALNSPSGLAVTATGSLLVADRLNHRVRDIDVDLLAVPAPTPTTPAEPQTTPTTPAEPQTTPTTPAEPTSPAAADAPQPGDGVPAAAASSPTVPSADAAHAPEVPVLGRAVVVAPVSGTILIRRPGAATATPLAEGEQIPVGSLLDARRGTVALTSALSGGATQTGRFGGGRFSVAQPAGGGGITELVLRGPELGACRFTPTPTRRTSTARAAARRRKPARRLWGEDKGGRFRTRGRNSVATVRGTRWLTEDTCAGTTTRVVEGAVDVYDVHRRSVRRVTAGRSLIVRAPAVRPAAR